MAKVVETTSSPKLPRERSHFRALILANPNHFGNLKGSTYKAAAKIALNTTYEEIGCVGFQPQFNRLDAVVFVKQPGGYGGNICSNGTPEYVRFYLSFDNGKTWQDQGLTSFTAYDIPATSEAKRLEYAVTLEINPPRMYCLSANLIRARAILSWNVPPPPNDDLFTPVWGNVHDTHIQIEPKKDATLGEVLTDLKVEFPVELGAIVDLEQTLASAQTKVPTALELKDLYKGKKVEANRFAFAEVVKHLQQPGLAGSLLATAVPSSLANLGLDLEQVLATVADVGSGDGNTSYEQLECVGLNPNQDALVGIIRVKLPYGFSGNLCTAGSREFVTFWADFDGNGTFETCLGTTSVNVHDIAQTPKDGLEYSVFLPVNFENYRQPCKKGARVVRIRAILSWQVPAHCANPNYVPVWGNREETTIHIKPGKISPPGTHFPFIETVAGMDVADISFATGLANGAAVTAGFTAVDSPFFGEIILTGHIGNSADITSGSDSLRYRVSVSPDNGASWAPQTNKLLQRRSQLLDGVWTNLPDEEVSVEPGNWYKYLEDLVGGPGNAQVFVKGNVLARWFAYGPSGAWLVKIEAMDPAAPAVIYTSNIVKVEVDTAAPSVSIAITSKGGDCGDFVIGDIIEGTYSATDAHFSHVWFVVAPALGGTFTAPSPLPSYPADPAGKSGTWKLNTAAMSRCGYVISVHASDRTIVNSGSVGHNNHAAKGFCLKP